MKSGIAKDQITLAAVGDIMLGGEILQYIQQYGAEFPFEHVAPIFKNSDISFGNLECPLTNEDNRAVWDYSKIIDKPILINGKVYGSAIYCKSIPEAARSLNSAGFNVLSLANNHIMDYGEQGLRDTISELKRYDIDSVGAGLDINEARNPLILHKNGITIGIIAYCDTYIAGKRRAGASSTKRIKQDITDLKKKVDHVIVSIHQGMDISEYPSQREIDFSHGIIDHGAIIVLRHHSHIVQGVEHYKKGLILYSLGNFVFDYTIDPLWKDMERARDAIIFKCCISKEGIVQSDIIPVRLNDHFQPVLLKGITKDIFCKRFEKISSIIVDIKKGDKNSIEVSNIKVEIILAYHALLCSIKKGQFRNILLILHRIDKEHVKIIIKFLKGRLIFK